MHVLFKQSPVCFFNGYLVKNKTKEAWNYGQSTVFIRSISFSMVKPKMHPHLCSNINVFIARQKAKQDSD